MGAPHRTAHARVRNSSDTAAADAAVVYVEPPSTGWGSGARCHDTPLSVAANCLAYCGASLHGDVGVMGLEDCQVACSLEVCVVRA